MPRRVIILGSTGSIGTQTIEVIEHLNRAGDRFEVVGLAAGMNGALLEEQARRLRVPHVAIATKQRGLDVAAGTKTYRGGNAAEELVRSVDCDLVVSAIVGIGGLSATLAAAELGCDIALANKEALVAAGALIIPFAIDSRSTQSILPVDSEHAALWQCLLSGFRPVEFDPTSRQHATAPPRMRARGLRRATLTASGGPFRTWTLDQMEQATPEQGLNHPTWRMGPKVTIDSASLMNKALEVIEAHWLFGLSPDQIQVLIHPQSIVHAMAEFVDGSVVAQMAAPDMRTPIQRALTWPRCESGVSRTINWGSANRLDFEPPDIARFPALSLAYKVIEAGGTSGAVLNAANEEAVDAFLDHRIGFGEIVRLVEGALADIRWREVHSLADVIAADTEARDWMRFRVPK
jgi:1-deoxy-D-xylulose-5-phosphate reductoisomerase